MTFHPVRIPLLLLLLPGSCHLSFPKIDAEPFHVGYTVLAAFIVIFGMFSLLLKERLYIGEAVWATVFGIIVGPYCAKIFDPREWATRNSVETNTVTLEVTRIVLAVGVFAIGVELPKAYLGRQWKSLTFLLAPIMVYGWFVCGGLIYALVPRLDFLTSLVIAACLTPTDPILAAAVVGGRYAEKHVPTHLRHLLAAESGVNDGAAFPMLFISLYLVLERSEATAVAKWFYITWLYEIILATVLGALLGYGFRHLMKFCERQDLIDRQSYVAQYVSLALLSNGIANILGSDDLLASFACGTAFAYDGWFNKKTEESMFSNVIDLLFNCACFIYIGAWIPFNDFHNPVLGLTPWRLLVISLLIILLRRLPIMLALYRWIPQVKTFREAVFSGHFGPMGIGAIFISTYTLRQIPELEVRAAIRPPETQLDLLVATIQPIVSFIVLVSIAIHGLSIPFFSLSRRVHSISRTWSRHTSMDPTGLPEWTTHTRRIAEGDEIIINRDPVSLDIVQKMERGDLERDITMTPSTFSDGPEDNVDFDGVTEGDGGAIRSTRSDDEGRPRSPYGGSDADSARTRNSIELTLRPGDTSEWREGPDLIIEQTVGDNEEVIIIFLF
ncbi:hypothetical protein BS47DRAFT_1288191 [Hydnum rufescens UP504]|uniref:Cation/H+ exchanger transmembrane domain-containing protein n=1 Tax=Hydnum rufescens UP504 TaxID=1448309 RepID=A0A9P6E1P1_9AGAM|nr:hypothetical protein BS47DRAFT_1288191 [Hydnum rufescens UP504]